MQTLQNKIIIVTGAGQGLGKAITTVLSETGATVIALDVKKEQIKKLAVDLQQQKRHVIAKQLDVTDTEQVEQIIHDIGGEFGRIDIVINNAGIDVTKPITQISQSEFDKVLSVNLRAPFVFSKLVFPLMQKQEGGHIINITSTAAKRAWENATAYHASKWGLLGLSYALFVEGKQHNIKVTAVVAGGMQTPFILDRFPNTPLNVLQDPKNVAKTILFLLTLPKETVIPEVMVLPSLETSWP